MTFLSYKNYRRYLVLNLIHSFGSISRTRLADITGYRPAAIGEIISELMEEQLIVETGSAHVGQGRRRTLLEINGSYICAIGMYISASSVTYAVSTIHGVILKTVETEIPESSSSSQLIAQIIATLRGLIQEFSHLKILGIGICDPGHDPGVLDTSTDFSVSFVHFNDWIHYDLRSILEESVGLPVETSSTSILISVAEQKFGAANGMNDFICLELCNGIGMSFFSNGSVVKGAAGMAGQIGHTVVHSNDRICYCGKPGCAEYSSSFPAIKANIISALNNGVASVLNTFYDRSRELTVSDVRRALDQHDKMCMHYVKEAAGIMGIAIANAVNMLNPEAVIFHGYMLELGDYFITALKEAILDNTLSYLCSSIVFKVSDISLDSMLPLGAAAMIFNSYLNTEEFKWILRLQDSAEEKP